MDGKYPSSCPRILFQEVSYKGLSPPFSYFHQFIQQTPSYMIQGCRRGCGGGGGKGLFLTFSIPLLLKSTSVALKLLLSPGGSQYAPLFQAQSLSLGWETAVSDSLSIPTAHWNTRSHFITICCSVIAKCKNISYCEYKPTVSNLHIGIGWRASKIKDACVPHPKTGTKGHQVIPVSRQAWEPLI